MQPKHKQILFDWFAKKNWSDPFVENGAIWGYPPGAVMPTPVPEDLITRLKQSGYQQRSAEDGVRAVKAAVTMTGVIAFGLICLSTLAGMFIPRQALYRVEAIRVDGRNSIPYQTHHRPFSIGHSTYFWCLGRFVEVSGDATVITTNPTDKAKGKIITCH